MGRGSGPFFMRAAYRRLMQQLYLGCIVLSGVAMVVITLFIPAGVFIEGVRPPLGLLVFDNGATVSMEADYLLGREPETDPRVQSGELRPLLVVDQTGGVMPGVSTR